MTMEFGRSSAERPQSVTSITVPPMSTSGVGSGRGGICLDTTWFAVCEKAEMQVHTKSGTHASKIRRDRIRKVLSSGLSHTGSRSLDVRSVHVPGGCCTLGFRLRELDELGAIIGSCQFYKPVCNLLRCSGMSLG